MTPGNNAPIVVPSFGAMRTCTAAALPLPAPGMFCTTIGRRAGNETGKVLGDRPRIDIVAAGGVGADDEGKGLAGVEIGGLRGWRARRTEAAATAPQQPLFRIDSTETRMSSLHCSARLALKT